MFTPKVRSRRLSSDFRPTVKPAQSNPIVPPAPVAAVEDNQRPDPQNLEDDETRDEGTKKKGKRKKDASSDEGKPRKKHKGKRSSTEKVDLEQADIQNMTIRDILRGTYGGKKTKAQLEREAEQERKKEEKRKAREEKKIKKEEEPGTPPPQPFEASVVETPEQSTSTFDQLLNDVDPDNGSEKEDPEYAVPDDVDLGLDEGDSKQDAANDDDEANDFLATQVTLVNGKMVFDRRSLVIDATTTTEPVVERRTVRESGSTFRNSGYKRRRPVDKWSDEDTDLFYKALRMCGPDFELIQNLFPGRERRHIYTKYKQEEKKNPRRLDHAFANPLPLDLELFKSKLGITGEIEDVASQFAKEEAPQPSDDQNGEEASNVVFAHVSQTSSPNQDKIARVSDPSVVELYDDEVDDFLGTDEDKSVDINEIPKSTTDPDEKPEKEIEPNEEEEIHVPSPQFTQSASTTKVNVKLEDDKDEKVDQADEDDGMLDIF